MDILVCRIISFKSFYLLAICLLYAFPMNANSAGAEREAVAYCITKGAVEPAAFAYCVGGALTTAEVKKCLSGGDCFGQNNALRQALQSLGVNFNHIQKFGPCGGPNSAARAIFGDGVCGSIDECDGEPDGRVTLVNQYNHVVKYHLEGRCSDPQVVELTPFSSMTTSGAGDIFYNITVTSPGGTVSYGLDSGTTHMFQWRGNLLDVVNATPRYGQ